MRWPLLLVPLALVACRTDEVDRADRAADEMKERQADLRDEVEDLNQKAARVEDPDELIEESEDVAEASRELVQAGAAFDERRAPVLASLRMRWDLYNTQAEMARRLLADPGLRTADVQNASDQMLRFEHELAESETAFDALATATSDQWDAAYATAAAALEQLEGAHGDTFAVLAVPRGPQQNTP